MTFLGLQALIDPPRPEAAQAIAQAQGAGIRVVMITGDNALTAQSIAGQLGIGQRAVTARELEGLDLPQLSERMREVDIVARATPSIKQQVLQALQGEGHFVAMTGDGVNDATALKQSDVGVAMGMRGTDIAKESAAMVLMDDNFATIVAAIEEGRRIFDNIRKFTNYLLSTSLGEVLVVLALSAFGYFPLSATMLLWVNVVTDLVPASALAADPAVPGIMQRRPRRHDEPILNKAIYATIGGSIFRTLIAYSLVFWAGLQFGGHYLRADDAVHRHRAACLYAGDGRPPVGQPLHLVEPGLAVELRRGGGAAVAGSVYTAAHPVRYSAAGLAGLGSDGAGAGRFLSRRCVYDPLDLEACTAVGVIKAIGDSTRHGRGHRLKRTVRANAWPGREAGKNDWLKREGECLTYPMPLRRLRCIRPA